MPSTNNDTSRHTERYKDGSVKATGPVLDGQPDGYWEWFRQDGSKMRSGRFAAGQPVGEWITYDRQRQVYKVTQRKPEATA